MDRSQVMPSFWITRAERLFADRIGGFANLSKNNEERGVDQLLDHITDSSLKVLNNNQW